MITAIKQSVICAEVCSYSLDPRAVTSHVPRAGDVALFEVVSVGKHSHIEVVTRRQAQIFPADRILAAFGNRYATGQYEGHVPTAPTEQLHILGQGGAIGLVKSAHSTMPKPTIVKLLGYAVDAQGQIINSKYYSRAPVRFSGDVPAGARVILSLGSSMDSGKTTTAGYVARSLKQIGKTVTYLKLTGTVFTKDMDFNKDCGADFVSDFSQLGFPSTYLCDEDELLDLYQTLLDEAGAVDPDCIIVEVADGLYQRETNMLLRNRRFLSTVSCVLFSCSDSVGAISGVQFLTSLGATPAAICGRYTMSPLLVEEVKAQCDIPTATLEEILTPGFADYIARSARSHEVAPSHKSEARLVAVA